MIGTMNQSEKNTMWFLSEREHKASPTNRIGKPTDLFDLISGRQDSLRNDEYNGVNDGVTDSENT